MVFLNQVDVMGSATGESERVCNIDIAACEKCQRYNGTIIACFLEPDVTQKNNGSHQQHIFKFIESIALVATSGASQ